MRLQAPSRSGSGRFELANRGTIFLDEIGEIRWSCNRNSCEYSRSASSSDWAASRTVRTDARLIAATNRDLKTMVEEQDSALICTIA